MSNNPNNRLPPAARVTVPCADMDMEQLACLQDMYLAAWRDLCQVSAAASRRPGKRTGPFHDWVNMEGMRAFNALAQIADEARQRKPADQMGRHMQAKILAKYGVLNGSWDDVGRAVACEQQSRRVAAA